MTNMEANYGAVNYAVYDRIAPADRMDISTEEAKGELYDVTNCRHYASRDIDVFVNWFRRCAAVNEAFTSGRIWGLQADYSSFLHDEGIPNTRQPIDFPLMQPMLLRLVGQGLKLQISPKVASTSQRAKTRMETAMMKAVMMSRGAAVGPDVRAAYEQIGVTPDEDEARSQFISGYWQDPLIKAMGTALNNMAIIQGHEALKKKVLINLAHSGAAAVHNYRLGQDRFWEVVETNDFIFDPNSKRDDMTDAEFLGFSPLIPIGALAERYRAKKAQLKHIEQGMKSGAKAGQAGSLNDSWNRATPRVYIMYYKDGEYSERAFIQSENGPRLVDAACIDPATGKRKYQESDFIDPPKTEETFDWNGKVDVRFKEVLRYCVFIPREYLPAIDVETGAPVTKEQVKDFVLESGVYTPQEFDPDATASVRFPIRVSTWMKIGGFIVAPLTAAQSPQRVINQVFTDVVWRMSNAPLPTIIVDKKSATQAGKKVADVLRRIKSGRPTELDATHIGGIPQAVHQMEGGIDPNIFRQFEIINALVGVAEDSVGLYKDNYGAPDRPNTLVRVKQMQLQQASIMQQPFLNATQSIFEQIHQWNANPGRSFYAQRPWRLRELVGDENHDILNQIKEFELEVFRVTTDIAISPEEQKQAADEQIMMQGGYMDRGLLGPEEAAKLLGKSFVDDINTEAVRYTRRRAEAQAKAAEAQAQAAEIAEAKDREAQLMEQESAAYESALDAAHKAEATQAKADMPIVAQAAKTMMPEVPA